MASTQKRELLQEFAIALIVGILLAGSAPFWFDPLLKVFGYDRTIAKLDGGCPGGVKLYAQNRWEPYGAAVRAQPEPGGRQVAGLAANQIAVVDGWVTTTAPYPYNTAPWNSDVWFHLADSTGWISFPGVRAFPTVHDPDAKQRGDGGQPAPTEADCEGSLGE